MKSKLCQLVPEGLSCVDIYKSMPIPEVLLTSLHIRNIDDNLKIVVTMEIYP